MPKKILVVEDNQDMRSLLHLQLTLEGFAVVVATNGLEGIYMASMEKPDLIITDISMPDMNGIEMTKQLRAQPETKAIPILALTAHGDNLMAQAIMAGASRAVNKPVAMDELIDDVNELLDESKRK